MRNLKRALSLAVASVMLLGMMVVGTGASYKDVTSANNQEAIEVLQAVGIMSGDDQGNFNPDQNVTRNEMAVVMSNLMDYRVASYKGTSPFTDVPEWAEPYVAACWTNGITAGYSATIYGGSDTVTTAQAALMLMKALGYFQYQSDFEDDWQLAVVKQGNKIDLFDDVDAGVREPMTRNELAQLVLNTLESGTVEADSDVTKVEAGDVKVETGSVKYNYLTSSKSYATAISSAKTGTGSATSNTSGSIIELGEKLYQGDLKKDDTAYSGFNAPANKWTYKAVEVGTYAEEADYVFVGTTKSKTVYSAVGKDAAKNYDWAVYLDGDRAVKAVEKTDDNGNKYTEYETDTSLVFTQAAVVANDSADLKGTGRGTTTYVYVDDDTKDIVVCIVSTYGAEITKVEDGTIYIDDDDLDFDIEGYEEEQTIIYTKSYDGSDWTIEEVLGVAEYVEGNVDQVKDVDTVIIDGTTYKYNTTVAAGDKIGIDSYDQTVGFYLDKQGHIVVIDDAVESGDYAYVISMGQETDKYGSSDITIYAKLALADGTVVKVEVDDDDYAQEGGKDSLKATADKFNVSYGTTTRPGSIVTYDVDDGVYSLTWKADAEAGKLVIDNGTTAIKFKNSVAYGDANTTYLYCDDYDDDEYTAYVGYKSVPDIEGDNANVAIYTKNGVAKFVFVMNADTKASAEDIVFVIGRTSEKPIKSAAGTYYEYKAVVKGETTVIRVKQGSSAETEYWNAMSGKSDKSVLVFAGLTENSKGLVTDLEAWDYNDEDLKYNTYTGTKRLSSAGLVGFGYISSSNDYNVWLGADDDAIVSYYEATGNTLGATGSINSLKTDTDDIAHVITDEGTIIAILVEDI